MKVNNKNTKESIFSFIVVILPFLSQYGSGIPGISLADILMITFLFYSSLSGKITINHKKRSLFILYTLFTIAQSLLSFLIQGDVTIKVFTRLLRYSYMMVSIIISLELINKKILIKKYLDFSLFSSLYILIQYIVYSVSEIVLPIKILPFTWYDGRTYNSIQALEWAKRWYFRPSGFYLEPSYAAQFLLPAFAIYLFSLNNENRNILNIRSILKPLLIGLALFLSTSNIAIILSSIILLIFLLKNIRTPQFKSGRFILNVMIVILIFVYLQGGLLEQSIDYIKNNSYTGGSTSFRILRGPAVYFALPMSIKLFGLGYGNVGSYLIKKDIFTSYDLAYRTLLEADYVSGISAVASFHGLFGILLWLTILIKYYYNSKIEGKIIIIIFTSLMFVSSMYISFNTLLYFSLVEAYGKDQE